MTSTITSTDPIGPEIEGKLIEVVTAEGKRVVMVARVTSGTTVQVKRLSLLRRLRFAFRAAREAWRLVWEQTSWE